MRTASAIFVLLVIGVLIYAGIHMKLFSPVYFEVLELGPFQQYSTLREESGLKAWDFTEKLASELTESGCQWRFKFVKSSYKNDEEEKMLEAGVLLNLKSVCNYKDPDIQSQIWEKKRYVVTEFPYVNKYSPAVATMMVLPRLRNYLNESGLVLTELYIMRDDGRLLFAVPKEKRRNDI